MKRCPKSRPGPQGLEAYRRQHPEGTWDQFRTEAPTAHQQTVETLRRDQGGLCAYCEFDLIPGRDQAVDHFHPKSDGSDGQNWHLDWENLLLSCRGGSGWISEQSKAEGRSREPRQENLSCDARKGAAVVDDTVLNPKDIPAFPRLLMFVGDGTAKPDPVRCAEAGIDPASVQSTLDTLGLNCPRLREARGTMLHSIERRIKQDRQRPGATAAAVLEKLAIAYLSKSPQCQWRPFFTLHRWRLGEAAEAFLRDSGYEG